MRIISFSYAYQQLVDTVRRFTLPVLFAITGSIAAVIVVDGNSPYPISTKLIYTSLLGLSFSLAVRLYTERRQSPMVRRVFDGLVVIAMALYYLTLAPAEAFEGVRQGISFAVLLFVSHLMVAVAAWLNVDDTEGFWWFNEVLFMRIIVSGIFSGALFTGLALALQACKQLFGIEFSDDYFGYLGIVIFGVFNTIFFLAGVPDASQQVETGQQFPKPLKIFVQYILIPLVLLYMVILYLYGLRISMYWNLPKGWVSMLVLFYTVAGILAVLLSHPLREDGDNAWVRLFSKFFFKATLPVYILYFAAIYRRISDYGFTEERYYGFVVGLWVTAICVYFSFARNRNIKAIPVSLAVVGILTLVGPWSAYSVSDRSQLARYQTAIQRIKTGNITLPKKSAADSVAVAFEGMEGYLDYEQVRSVEHGTAADIIEYFVARQNEKLLQPFFKLSLTALRDTFAKSGARDEYYSGGWMLRSRLTDTLQRLAGVTHYGEEPHYRSVTLDKGICMGITGYSSLQMVDWDRWSNVRKVYYITEDDSVIATLRGRDSAWMQLERNGRMLSPMDVHTWLKGVRLLNDSVPATQRELQFSTKDGSISILATRVTFNDLALADTVHCELAGIDGYLLIR